MSYTEHSSLFKHTTANPAIAADEATERTLMSDLGEDLGAPFELYIKNSGNVGSSGILKYTETPGATANITISDDETKEIGNNVHRILKYYLGSQYVVSDISQVRLNVFFRSQ